MSDAPLTQAELRAALVARHGETAQQVFDQARVGIAGLGGLGSRVAELLTRLGIGTLVLVDYDCVEPTNLNRQHYDLRHLGRRKADALAEQLRAINPYLTYETHAERVVPERVASLFAACAVVCECFDAPDQKALFTEAVLTQLPHTPLVAASGMGGADSANTVRTAQPFERLYICGDGVSDIAQTELLAAPRVALCAAHQACMVMRLLLGQPTP